jgi:tetratricopeptide (TPR) repeat protein
MKIKKTKLKFVLILLILSLLILNFNPTEAQTGENCIFRDTVNCGIGALECVNGKLRSCNGEGGGGTPITSFWCSTEIDCDEPKDLVGFTATQGGPVSQGTVFNHYTGTDTETTRFAYNHGPNIISFKIQKKNENNVYVDVFPEAGFQNPDTTQPITVKYVLPLGTHEMRMITIFQYDYFGQLRTRERKTDYTNIVSPGTDPGDGTTEPPPTDPPPTEPPPSGNEPTGSFKQFCIDELSGFLTVGPNNLCCPKAKDNDVNGVCSSCPAGQHVETQTGCGGPRCVPDSQPTTPTPEGNPDTPELFTAQTRFSLQNELAEACAAGDEPTIIEIASEAGVTPQMLDQLRITQSSSSGLSDLGLICSAVGSNFVGTSTIEAGESILLCTIQACNAINQELNSITEEDPRYDTLQFLKLQASFKDLSNNIDYLKAIKALNHFIDDPTIDETARNYAMWSVAEYYLALEKLGNADLRIGKLVVNIAGSLNVAATDWIDLVSSASEFSDSFREGIITNNDGTYITVKNVHGDIYNLKIADFLAERNTQVSAFAVGDILPEGTIRNDFNINSEFGGGFSYNIGSQTLSEGSLTNYRGKAIDIYTSIIQRNIPGFDTSSLRLQLGDLYLIENDWEQASWAFNVLTRQDRGYSNEIQSKALVGLSKVSLNLKDPNYGIRFEKALEQLEDAITRDPLNTVASSEKIKLQRAILDAIAFAVSESRTDLERRFNSVVGRHESGLDEWVRSVFGESAVSLYFDIAIEPNFRIQHDMGELSLDQEEAGVLALKAIANNGGDITLFVPENTASNRLEEIRDAFKIDYSGPLPPSTGLDPETIEIIEQGGPELKKILDFDGAIRMGTLQNEDLRLLVRDGVGGQFKFKTGESYNNPEILKPIFMDALILDSLSLTPEVVLVTTGGFFVKAATAAFNSQKAISIAGRGFRSTKNIGESSALRNLPASNQLEAFIDEADGRILYQQVNENRVLFSRTLNEKGQLVTVVPKDRVNPSQLERILTDVVHAPTGQSHKGTKGISDLQTGKAYIWPKTDDIHHSHIVESILRKEGNDELADLVRKAAIDETKKTPFPEEVLRRFDGWQITYQKETKKVYNLNHDSRITSAKAKQKIQLTESEARQHADIISSAFNEDIIISGPIKFKKDAIHKDHRAALKNAGFEVKSNRPTVLPPPPIP